MNRSYLTTFGGVALRRDGLAIPPEATQPRRIALLVLLAAGGERGVTRDRVMSIFWPDAEEERGRKHLAQSLYVLRQAFGDEAVSGVQTLTLNTDIVASDVNDFNRALQMGDMARAATAYHGPFLEGFRAGGLPEFDRWMDSERSRLTHQFHDLLERLAKDADRNDRPEEALKWWKRLASADPLDARVALSLMQCLVRNGDRPGALRTARIHEELVRQELEVSADQEVIAFAEALRKEGNPERVGGHRTRDAAKRDAATPVAVELVLSPGTTPSVEAHEAEPPVSTAIASAPDPLPTSSPAYITGLWRRFAVLGVASVVVAVAVLAFRGRPDGAPKAGNPDPSSQPMLAIGTFDDFASSPGERNAQALANMVATNLARTPDMRVLSPARMLELAAAAGSSSHDFTTAARRAGATSIIEGDLHRQASGRYRLDLREVRVADGSVRQAHAIEGTDIFALADSGTRLLARELGARAPDGSIAEVTTRSLAAYTLYQEGLRAWFSENRDDAPRLFDAALRQDSTFAMAAYWRAVTGTTDDDVSRARNFTRAVGLAAGSPDRERLLIRAHAAMAFRDPELRSYAESLAIRFPTEPDGHYWLGLARAADGDYLGSARALRTVIAMDSTGIDGRARDCRACRAYGALVDAWIAADSAAAAVRIAREWVSRQPKSAIALRTLAGRLAVSGRFDEAREALDRAAREDSVRARRALWDVDLLVREGNLLEAERLARSEIPLTSGDALLDAWWQLISVLRNARKWPEALDEARRFRVAFDQPSPLPGAVSVSARPLAVVLGESGDWRAAAALQDSISRWPIQSRPSMQAGQRAWILTHAADAYASAGDTAVLSALADTIEALGALSGFERDRRLHWHVRGRLLAARGDTAGALDALRRAVISFAAGYTRTNAETARLLIARGRGREAVAVLMPALRAYPDGGNYYLTRAETHELLAQAWSVAEGRHAADSATVHRQYGKSRR